MICPHCRTHNDAIAKFCSNCGVQLITQTEEFCPKCGAKRNIGDLFCANCGTNLGTKSETDKKKKKTRMLYGILSLLAVCVAFMGIFYGYPCLKDKRNGYIRLLTCDDAVEKLAVKSVIAEREGAHSCAFFTIVSVPKKPNQDGQYICSLTDYFVNKQNGLFQFYAFGEAVCDKDGKILGDDQDRHEYYDFNANAWMSAKELANAVIHYNGTEQEKKEREIVEKSLIKVRKYLQRKKIVNK